MSVRHVQEWCIIINDELKSLALCRILWSRQIISGGACHVFECRIGFVVLLPNDNMVVSTLKTCWWINKRDLKPRNLGGLEAELLSHFIESVSNVFGVDIAFSELPRHATDAELNVYSWAASGCRLGVLGAQSASFRWWIFIASIREMGVSGRSGTTYLITLILMVSLIIKLTPN